MKTAARLALALAGSIALIGGLVELSPISTPRALAIWMLLAAALAIATFVGRAREAAGLQEGGRFEAALRRRPPAPGPPAELLRMERQLELGVANAMSARLRLLPLLRAAAAARLGSSRGIDLERNPDGARAALGDEVWELLRPDRPEPADRHGPGVPRRQIELVVDRLESL